jgi:hypothetical protein
VLEGLVRLIWNYIRHQFIRNNKQHKKHSNYLILSQNNNLLAVRGIAKAFPPKVFNFYAVGGATVESHILLFLCMHSPSMSSVISLTQFS